MTQEITIPKNFGQVSKVFGNVQAANDLAAGIQASFAVVKYRGKVWSVSYRGTETPVLRADGDGQANSVEVVILKASPVISKTFYLNGWTPGMSEPPDCFSNDGIKPDDQSPAKQNDICKTCKNNYFGTGQGGRGKACADNKKLVVVPLDDLHNDAYGGPMLLRVPPASLQNMAAYGEKLRQFGYPAYAVATRVSFDLNVTHPQFIFGAIRALSDEEASVVQELLEDERVDRILSVAHEDHSPAQQTTADAVFEQPPQPKRGLSTGAHRGQNVPQSAPNVAPVPKPVPKSTPKAAAVDKPIAKPAPQIVDKPSTGGVMVEAMGGGGAIEEGAIMNGADEEAQGADTPALNDLDAALAKLL